MFLQAITSLFFFLSLHNHAHCMHIAKDARSAALNRAAPVGRRNHDLAATFIHFDDGSRYPIDKVVRVGSWIQVFGIQRDSQSAPEVLYDSMFYLDLNTSPIHLWSVEQLRSLPPAQMVFENQQIMGIVSRIDKYGQRIVVSGYRNPADRGVVVTLFDSWDPQTHGELSDQQIIQYHNFISKRLSKQYFRDGNDIADQDAEPEYYHVSIDYPLLESGESHSEKEEEEPHVDFTESISSSPKTTLSPIDESGESLDQSVEASEQSVARSTSSDSSQVFEFSQQSMSDNEESSKPVRDERSPIEAALALAEKARLKRLEKEQKKEELAISNDTPSKAPEKASERNNRMTSKARQRLKKIEEEKLRIAEEQKEAASKLAVSSLVSRALERVIELNNPKPVIDEPALSDEPVEQKTEQPLSLKQNQPVAAKKQPSKSPKTQKPKQKVKKEIKQSKPESKPAAVKEAQPVKEPSSSNIAELAREKEESYRSWEESQSRRIIKGPMVHIGSDFTPTGNSLLRNIMSFINPIVHLAYGPMYETLTEKFLEWGLDPELVNIRELAAEIYNTLGQFPGDELYSNFTINLFILRELVNHLEGKIQECEPILAQLDKVRAQSQRNIREGVKQLVEFKVPDSEPLLLTSKQRPGLKMKAQHRVLFMSISDLSAQTERLQMILSVQESSMLDEGYTLPNLTTNFIKHLNERHDAYRVKFNEMKTAYELLRQI